MCQCCYSVPSGRVYTRDFEPAAERPFSHSYESSLLSVWQGKGPDVHPLTRSLIHPETALTSPVHSSSRPLLHTELIHRFITEHQQGKRVPLCINPQSAAFKTFIRFCFQLFFYCVFCSGCRFVTVRPQRWSLHQCPPRSASHFSSVTEGCFFFFPSPGQQRGIHPRFPRRRKDEG